MKSSSAKKGLLFFGTLCVVTSDESFQPWRFVEKFGPSCCCCCHATEAKHEQQRAEQERNFGNSQHHPLMHLDACGFDVETTHSLITLIVPQQSSAEELNGCQFRVYTLREIIYISYKIWDQGPRIGIPCCIVLHFLCRNVSKLVVIGYSGEGTKILYLSII